LRVSALGRPPVLALGWLGLAGALASAWTGLVERPFHTGAVGLCCVQPAVDLRRQGLGTPAMGGSAPHGCLDNHPDRRLGLVDGGQSPWAPLSVALERSVRAALAPALGFRRCLAEAIVWLARLRFVSPADFDGSARWLVRGRALSVRPCSRPALRRLDWQCWSRPEHRPDSSFWLASGTVSTGPLLVWNLAFGWEPRPGAMSRVVSLVVFRSLLLLPVTVGSPRLLGLLGGRRSLG
jgi:hypothetical protein